MHYGYGFFKKEQLEHKSVEPFSNQLSLHILNP